MNDKEWNEKCDKNYEIAANVLTEEGYTRTAQTGMIPFIFTKEDETVYLVRELESSKWYPVNMKQSPGKYRSTV